MGKYNCVIIILGFVLCIIGEWNGMGINLSFPGVFL